jgi:hypothetical protein
MMIHEKWNSNGRTFATDVKGQKVYKSAVGQNNVDLGNGDYIPYVWDQANKRLRFGKCEIRLGITGIEFWFDGEKLHEGRFRIEKKSGTWGNISTIASGLSIQETITEESFNTVTLSYDVDSTDFNASISLKVGGFDKAHFGYSFKAKNAGEFRVVWENDITETGKPIYGFNNSVDKNTVTYGYETSKSTWKWLYEEIPDHVIEDTAEKINFYLKEGTYVKDEIKNLNPTTWGPTGIAADADDGNESDPGTWYENGKYGDNKLYINYSDDCLWFALRFENVNLGGTPSTIDAGSYLTLVNPGDNTGLGTVQVTIKCAENNNPAEWTVTKPSAVADWTETTVTYTCTTSSPVSIDLESVIAELVETNGYSYSGSEPINIGVLRLGVWGAANWSGSWDYGGTTAATLTIVYTAAAGATLEQEGFRARNDDGNEAAATWLATQDTNITRAKNTNTRLRMLVNATGDPPANAYRIECRKQGVGDFKKIN